MKISRPLLLIMFLTYACVTRAESYNPNVFVNAHSEFFHLLNADHDDIKLGYYYQPETEEEDGEGEFALQKGFARFDLPMPISRNSFFRFGANYEYRGYDFKQSASSLPSDALHKLEIASGFGTFLSDNTLFTVIPTLGMYSDMDGMSEEDFQLHGKSYFVHRVNPGSAILLGAAYDETFDDTPIYPLLGVRMLSNDGSFHLVITLPTEIKMAFNVTPQTQYYIGGWINGDEYRYSGDQDDFNVSIRENRVGLGLIQWFNDSVNLQLEAGAQIRDEFNFKTDDTTLFENDVETAPYIWAAFGFAL